MGNNPLRFTNVRIRLLVPAALLCLSTPALAQSSSTQNTQTTPDRSNEAAQNTRPVQDNGVTRSDVTQFDRFLDGHREIAEQVRRDPSLLNNRKFVREHPDLQNYLRDNPGVRDEIRQDPNGLMQRESRFEANEDGRYRDAGRGQDLARFNRFLGSHREIAEQLRRDPSLVDNHDFVRNHPELQGFLRDNPGVRDRFNQHPNALMRQEEQYNRTENVQDRDNRQDVAQFDRFLDSHREIAEQVRKDPSLLQNREFAQNHPALRDYLRDNPGVRDEVRQDPNALMHREDRFDAAENWRNRDAAHQHMASFGQFLGGHSGISDDMSKNPSLVKNREYVENHPELNDYLHSHPDVRGDLMHDPDGFVKGSRQFTNGIKGAVGTTTNVNGSGVSTGASATGSTHTPGVSPTGAPNSSDRTHQPKPKL